MDLTLANRSLLTLTGIKKIKSSEPGQVVAALENCMIVITGSNLSVQSASVKEGNLEISGMVTSIKYTNTVKKGFSIRNMFR
ncbi:MAG: hypothetical protein FWE38_00920 [Firmicutes bacterium]|nr:hypothetical protein [Bacillota bacterium]